MRQPETHPPCLLQTGSSLLEVLVAVLVLGIGLLGFATSQMQSLGALNQAGAQLQARLLAVELVEHWRAAGSSIPSATELAAWRERAETRLPAGAAEIVWPAGPSVPGRVSLIWADRSSERQARLALEFGS